MTAVIYARYSSDNQREESIEGQIRECTAYAEKKVCVCEATKAQVGLSSNRTVLRKQDGGALPRQVRICPALLDHLKQTISR